MISIFTVTGDDRCILYCRVYQSNLYYPLKEKVIDGTPCAPESFDICVNGQCKPAGCDHILSSDVRLGEVFELFVIFIKTPFLSSAQALSFFSFFLLQINAGNAGETMILVA